MLRKRFIIIIIIIYYNRRYLGYNLEKFKSKSLRHSTLVYKD